MGISSVLGKSFGILKANPKIILPYFVLTAVIGIISVYLSLSLASAATGYGVNTVSSFFSLALGTLVKLVLLLILIIVLVVFAIPLLISMYIDIADQGHKKKTVSLERAFGVAKSNYLNTLLLSILITIIWIIVSAVLGAVFVAPVILLGGLGTVLWLILGLIVSLVVLVALSIYLFEAYTVLILERLGPVSAIKRSLEIGKQKLGLLFRVFLLLFLVAIVFIIVDSAVVYLIEASVGLSGQKLLGLGIAETVNFLFSSAFSSWFIMIPVAFYKAYVVKGSATRKRNR